MLPLITRVSASEQAYSNIKKMIVRGELLPGAVLAAQTLADQMGVSRTPVVEAIRHLERDGLVVTTPNCGTHVKQWSRHDGYEAYCIRRVLEGEAARLFVLHAQPADKKKLLELSEIYDEYCRSDPGRAAEADLELHLHVARSTGFARLSDLVESSHTSNMVIYGLIDKRTRDPKEQKAKFLETVGVHNPLVKALLRNDPEKATKAMWNHIVGYLQTIQSLPEDAAEENGRSGRRHRQRNVRQHA